MQSTTDFIAIVKQQEAIYDTTNTDYKNMERKSIAWKNVAENADLSVEACKRKWKNLRDSYTKYLRSFRTGSKTSRKYQYWAHAEHMDFLRPFQGPIRSQPKEELSYEFDGFVDQSTPKLELISDLGTDMFEKFNTTADDDDEDELQINNNAELQTNLQISDVKESVVLQSPDIKEPEMVTMNMATPIQPHIKHKSSKRNSLSSLLSHKTSDLDSNSLFFLSLAKAVKVMPKKYQAAVKMSCMKIVNDAELDIENITMLNNYTGSDKQNQKFNSNYPSENHNHEQQAHQQMLGENSEHFLYVMSPSRVEAMIDISSEEEVMNN